MARKYKLGAKRPELDRDALLRALSLYDLGSVLQRRQACRAVIAACSEATMDDTWLWAYGLHLALAGHEEPLQAAPSSVIVEGYQDGAGLLPAGEPLVHEWPLGQRRALTSASPGRCWLN